MYNHDYIDLMNEHCNQLITKVILRMQAVSWYVVRVDWIYDFIVAKKQTLLTKFMHSIIIYEKIQCAW